MIEQWIQWQPIENINQKYNVAAIVDTVDGFILRLTSIKSHGMSINIIYLKMVYMLIQELMKALE